MNVNYLKTVKISFQEKTTNGRKIKYDLTMGMWENVNENNFAITENSTDIGEHFQGQMIFDHPSNHHTTLHARARDHKSILFRNVNNVHRCKTRPRLSSTNNSTWQQLETVKLEEMKIRHNCFPCLRMLRHHKLQIYLYESIASQDICEVIFRISVQLKSL